MLFEIGFMKVTWIDLVDILLVAFLFYRLYLVMRGTIAIQIFIGLLVITATSFLAQAINLQALSSILRTLTDIWVIAFIILFQPELRRLLVMLGRGRFTNRLFRKQMASTIDEIVGACVEMAHRQVGALIVIVRSTGIRMIVETGIQLKAEVSKQLLLSIFHPRAPLHDGAVVIADRRIEAARCTLPLTAQTQVDGFIMGMRHRSALGMSEQADVIAIVVSEETGLISVAIDGRLLRGLTGEDLRTILNKEMRNNVKEIFQTAFSEGDTTEE